MKKSFEKGDHSAGQKGKLERLLKSGATAWSLYEITEDERTSLGNYATMKQGLDELEEDDK